MSIAILTPSRGRPDQLNELIEAIKATARGGVVLYVGIDDDDEEYAHLGSGGYAMMGDGSFLPGLAVEVVRGPRKQLGPWTNELAKMAIADGHEIIASFGDDHRPRTMGWDLQVAEAFADLLDGKGLVYTADGLQDENLPTAPFWSANVIHALGWYFHPDTKHMYADNLWLDIANRMETQSRSPFPFKEYLSNVLIEHCHPSAGKAEADLINMENDTHYDADQEVYMTYVASGQMNRDVDRVLREMGV